MRKLLSIQPWLFPTREIKTYYSVACTSMMLSFDMMCLKGKEFYHGVDKVPSLTATGWADVHDWQGRIVDITSPPPHSVFFVFRRKDAAPATGAQRVIGGTETNRWSEAVPLSPSGSWKSFTTFSDAQRTLMLHYKKVLLCKVCMPITLWTSHNSV